VRGKSNGKEQLAKETRKAQHKWKHQRGTGVWDRKGQRCVFNFQHVFYIVWFNYYILLLLMTTLRIAVGCVTPYTHTHVPRDFVYIDMNHGESWVWSIHFNSARRFKIPHVISMLYSLYSILPPHRYTVWDMYISWDLCIVDDTKSLIWFELIFYCTKMEQQYFTLTIK
jgi:hypothetical protein